MKKLLIILSLALIGCDSRRDKAKINLEDRYETVIIERCEYIMVIKPGTYGLMAHKGNCKNH